MAAEAALPGSDFWSVVAQGALVLLGLLVLARLMAFAVRPRRQGPVARGRRAEFRWLVLTWSGLLLVLAVTVSWTIFAVTGDDGPASRSATRAMLLVAAVVSVVVLALAWEGARIRGGEWWTLLLLLAALWATIAAAPPPVRGYLVTGALTAAGVVTFGLGLGSRLRMRLTVRRPDGSEDSAGAAYVVARLSTMGGNRPRGLTSPQGADVLNLPKEAVSALPAEGQLAAGLLRFGILLFSVAPWRADIVLVDDTTATVDVRRNGGQAASTLIFRSELGLNGFDADADAASAPGRSVTSHDVLTAAAAFLLLELGRSHPALQEGLCGTTHWRSLACQVLAGTPPWEANPRAAEHLFATAVEKDPGNNAAWLGYLYLRAGTAVGAEENEERYVSRLSSLYQRLVAKENEAGYGALCMRAAYALASAHVNYGLLLSQGPRQEEYSAAAKVCRQLRKWVEEAKRSPDAGLRDFAEEMEPKAQILYSGVTKKSTTYSFDESEAHRPSHYYAQACVDVERKDHPKALEHLDLALGLEKYRVPARTDPSLRPLWEDEGTAAQLAALVDRPQLEAIEALQPYRRNLRKAGIRFPEELIAREKNRAKLAEALGVPEATVEWMREICRLAAGCPRPENAIPWTDLLTREGVDSREALADVDHDPGEKQRLTRLAWTVGAPPLTDDCITEWLEHMDDGDGRGPAHRRTARQAGRAELAQALARLNALKAALVSHSPHRSRPDKPHSVR